MILIIGDKWCIFYFYSIIAIGFVVHFFIDFYNTCVIELTQLI